MNSEARFRSLFNQSPASIQLLSPDGRTLEVNQAWMNRHGVTREFVDSYIKKEYNILKDPQLAAKGVLPYLQKGFAGESAEIPATLYDPMESGIEGRARWVTASITPIKGPDGAVTEILLMHTDVTERMQAEQLLALLAETPLLLAASQDLNATLQKIADLGARHFAAWCRLSLHDENGKPLVALSRPKSFDGQGLPDASTFPFRVEEALREGKPVLIRRIGPELSGDFGFRSVIQVPLRPERRDGAAICLVSSGRLFHEGDLRIAQELARRAMLVIENSSLFESAQNAVRIRNEFISIASHEFKTPLTSVKLLLQLIRERVAMSAGVPSAPLKIEEIIDRSELMLDRLDAQVDELLDVAGISSGNLVLARAECDLQRLVLRLTDQYREQLLAAGCHLSVDSTGPVVGFWDERRIEGAIGNLLANAMKYAPGKPIEVSLRTQPGLAVLIVRDHGIGIDPEAQSRIFNLFERAVSSQHYGGLGLGLYIARKALEAHGGSIDVRSEPGQGAEFTIELPISGA